MKQFRYLNSKMIIQFEDFLTLHVYCATGGLELAAKFPQWILTGSYAAWVGCAPSRCGSEWGRLSSPYFWNNIGTCGATHAWTSPKGTILSNWLWDYHGRKKEELVMKLPARTLIEQAAVYIYIHWYHYYKLSFIPFDFIFPNKTN